MSKTKKRKWNLKRKDNKNKKNSEWQDKEINKHYSNSMKNLKKDKQKLKKEEFNFKNKKKHMLNN